MAFFNAFPNVQCTEGGSMGRIKFQYKHITTHVRSVTCIDSQSHHQVNLEPYCKVSQNTTNLFSNYKCDDMFRLAESTSGQS